MINERKYLHAEREAEADMAGSVLAVVRGRQLPPPDPTLRVNCARPELLGSYQDCGVSEPEQRKMHCQIRLDSEISSKVCLALKW